MADALGLRRQAAAAAAVLAAANNAFPLNLIQGNVDDDPNDDPLILSKPVKPMLDHIPAAAFERDKKRKLYIADDLRSEDAEVALYNSELRLEVYELVYKTLEERKKYVKSELNNLRAEVATQRQAVLCRSRDAGACADIRLINEQDLLHFRRWIRQHENNSLFLRVPPTLLEESINKLTEDGFKVRKGSRN